MSQKIKPIRLRLELKDEYVSDQERRILKRYGESISGDSITRDILIPSDMPLHNLHYVIQQAFGWKNSHLRSFYLDDERYHELTGGTVKGWVDLVGVLFQPPSEGEYDVFWDDDYRSGSVKTWLRRKYTGPYYYGGVLEHEEAAKEDVNMLLEQCKDLEVRESFEQYYERTKGTPNAPIKILRRAPLIDLTLDEMHDSILIENGTNYLFERLLVDDVIANQNEDIDKNQLFPLTKELIYNYDFGDNWIIKIRKIENCDDLLEDNIIGEEELEEARNHVLKKHQPICIHRVGLSLVDDIGGLGGFARLLETLYEGNDKEYVSQMRTWAKSMGWDATKRSIKTML